MCLCTLLIVHVCIESRRVRSSGNNRFYYLLLSTLCIICLGSYMLKIKVSNVLLMLLCIFFLLAVQAAKNGPRRNVVLIIFDDLRPALGGYGDHLAQTPHLDAFIKESHYFTRAYSQQSLCAPSRNSMLTGRRPDTLHLYDFYNYWRDFTGNFSTLPQYFKAHNYYTYGIGKVFHPGISSNNTDDYPYSWSLPVFRPQSEKYMNSPVCPDAGGVLRKNLICPVHLQTQPLKTLPDIESIAEAIRFVGAYKRRRPFFLAVGFHKPHINFRFPQQFIDQFRLEDFNNYTTDTNKPEDMPNVAWNPYIDVRSRDDFKHQNISFPYGPISARHRSQIRQAYYASVAYVDDLFGKFIVHLNKSNTVVLVTSDHGWSLGEHAEWAKYSNFEVALRVPLIIRSPEFPTNASQNIQTIAELIDIFPTLVDLAHLPSLPSCEKSAPSSQNLICGEGKSLYPVLQGVGTNEEYVALSQYPRPGIEPTKHPNSDKPKLSNIKVMGYSIRTHVFRYTLWVRFNAHDFSKDWNEIFGEELYDHRLDEGEDVNLAKMPEYNETRTLLRQQLITAFSK
ncbi:iduronate 2-sulfatase isoform X1 [Bactrocera neohumeralis]|uniref:iduronate 2-sulfatase isoform X1 n=2 Tax=Bactrocera tryoni TaxID=59916 RepID=UPI001A997490|nr:iduronate 2-sulfatase isoform X1 [Bactrocera tryoni]XP_039963590.1 iduronate 2-sulfatase isoform X1 [Bactrocera tryoni]XP_050336605.1 iduronate 2-sulfatase isoform X1 [Bactrocera neohumeralis]XP_050336606.1 iduronate 2-sulfatase isoform X1 [Bactrocera neohumeralis]